MFLFCFQASSEKLRKKLSQSEAVSLLHQRNAAEMVNSLRDEMVSIHAVSTCYVPSSQLTVFVCVQLDFDSLLGTGLEDGHEVGVSLYLMSASSNGLSFVGHGCVKDRRGVH